MSELQVMLNLMESSNCPIGQCQCKHYKCSPNLPKDGAIMYCAHPLNPNDEASIAANHCPKQPAY